MVDGRVILFADIAILLFDDIAKRRFVLNLNLLKVSRRKTVGRGENGLPPQLADTRLVQRFFRALRFSGFAVTFGSLHQLSPHAASGSGNLAGGLQQSPAFRFGNTGQQFAIGWRWIPAIRRSACICSFSGTWFNLLLSWLIFALATRSLVLLTYRRQCVSGPRDLDSEISSLRFDVLG